MSRPAGSSSCWQRRATVCAGCISGALGVGSGIVVIVGPVRDRDRDRRSQLGRRPRHAGPRLAGPRAVCAGARWHRRRRRRARRAAGGRSRRRHPDDPDLADRHHQPGARLARRGPRAGPELALRPADGRRLGRHRGRRVADPGRRRRRGRRMGLRPPGPRRLDAYQARQRPDDPGRARARPGRSRRPGSFDPVGPGSSCASVWGEPRVMWLDPTARGEDNVRNRTHDRLGRYSEREQSSAGNSVHAGGRRRGDGQSPLGGAWAE